MGIGEAGEKLRRSTVQVWNGSGLSRSRSSGSGVIWDSSGALVTNAHVIRSGDITVELWDGRAAPARLDRRDDWRDLAILRVETGHLDPAAIGDSSRVRAGEFVIAVGNPMGFTGALSTGIVRHRSCMVLARFRAWVGSRSFRPPFGWRRATQADHSRMLVAMSLESMRRLCPEASALRFLLTPCGGC